MSNYSDNLGFIPSNPTESLKRLKIALENTTGAKFNSDEEFLASNINQLFLGFSLQKAILERNIVALTNAYFQYLTDTNSKIEASRSGTYLGFAKALEELFTNGVAFWTFDQDPTLLPGICLIGVDNLDENDQPQEITAEENTALIDIFRNYFPAGIQTFRPEPAPKPLQSIDVEHINKQLITYYFDKAEPIPLYILVKYRRKDHSVSERGEVEEITSTFVESFYANQKIAMDFDPQSYISSQNIDWMASCKVGYKINETDPDYTFSKIEAESVFKKFVISKTGGQYSILVEEDDSI